MSSRVDSITIDVSENIGSRNHPYYARIYVDGYMVTQRSFMSMKDAEKVETQLLKDTVAELTRKLRAFSKAHYELSDETIEFQGKPRGPINFGGLD